MKYKLFSFLVLTVISNLHCIKYSLSGSIPPHIKTISIPLINNETAEHGIAEKLTDIIINRFNEEGILNVNSNDKVDSKLIGLIKKISESPYTYSKNESVSEYRYRIDISLEWYDNINDVSIIKGVYNGWGAYGISGDISTDGIDNDGDGLIDADDDNEIGDAREFASNVAMEKIADDIINEIMTTW